VIEFFYGWLQLTFEGTVEDGGEQGVELLCSSFTSPEA